MNNIVYAGRASALCSGLKEICVYVKRMNCSVECILSVTSLVKRIIIAIATESSIY